MDKVLFSSARSDWETPPELYAALNTEFRFDLDAAASPDNAKCPRFYSEAEDGLTQPWQGSVWCNPPYGRDVGRWVQRGYEAARDGKATVVMLLPARTDTRWFHDYIWSYRWVEVRFIRGRLKFVGAKDAAPFPSMVVIWRRQSDV